MVSKKKSTKKAKPAGATKKSRRSDQPVGTTIARISNAQIIKAESAKGAKASKTPRVKAVLFVPEGQDPKNLDLNLQVVSVSPMGLGVISARRC